MPFKTFNNWLFDGDVKKPIPKELLAYNSPITPQYAIRLFLYTPELNHFLNKHLNNIGMLYLDKQELFGFLKKCVKDFRVNRYNLPYFSYRKEDKLVTELKRKFPLLKDYDVVYLSELVKNMPDKDNVYSALGLDTPKKEKLKNQKNKKQRKISVKAFLKKNFVWVEV